jgi:hypothetical protein
MAVSGCGGYLRLCGGLAASVKQWFWGPLCPGNIPKDWFLESEFFPRGHHGYHIDKQADFL